jgi:hypothetical protein
MTSTEVFLKTLEPAFLPILLNFIVKMAKLSKLFKPKQIEKPPKFEPICLLESF